MTDYLEKNSNQFVDHINKALDCVCDCNQCVFLDYCMQNEERGICETMKDAIEWLKENKNTILIEEKINDSQIEIFEFTEKEDIYSFKAKWRDKNGNNHKDSFRIEKKIKKKLKFGFILTCKRYIKPCEEEEYDENVPYEEMLNKLGIQCKLHDSDATDPFFIMYLEIKKIELSFQLQFNSKTTSSFITAMDKTEKKNIIEVIFKGDEKNSK